jgi:predicted RNA-binding Zn-ribbon protein involved in translation (DUF1610 family)
MPLITPPNDYGQPEPKEEKVVTPCSWEEHRRITLYLNVKPWKCPDCGATMFGRMLYCAYCKLRLNKHTPRPSHYTKEHGA